VLHICLLPIFSYICNQKLVISITASSPETSCNQHNRMPSLIYQYVINLVVSLSLRGGPGLRLNVSVGERRALNN